MLPPPLVLSVLAGLAPALGPTSVSSEDPRDALLRGVDAIASPGHPGGVTVFGSEAWPIVMGGQVPVCAAAEAEAGEAGRLVALTQGGYVGAGVVGTADTERFLRNALSWLSDGKKKPLMAQVGGGGCALADALGLVTVEDWLDADVLVATSGALEPHLLPDVRAFLEDGGGVLLGDTPWGWQQLSPKLDLARDHRLNRLMAPFGLAFDRRFSKDPGDAYTIGGGPGTMVNARRAFVALSGGASLSGEERSQAEASVQAAVTCLSDHEPTLMLPMRRFAATGTGDFATKLAGWLASETERRGMRPLAERWGPWHLVGPFAAGGFGREGRLLGKAQRIEKEIVEHTAGSPGPDLDKEWKGKGWRTPVRALELERDGRDLDVEELQLEEVLGRRLDEKARAKDWAAGAAAYMYRRIELDEPRSYTVEVAGDGGVGVWLDGLLLGEAYEEGGMARLTVELALDPGVHHLWVKAVHEVGNWRFRMGGEEGVDQSLVDAASERAVNYLVKRQHVDGSWTGHEAYGSGYTAMVIYGLVMSGYGSDHPVIRRGLAYLDAYPAKKTYSLCAEVLARSVADREATVAWYQGAVDQLADWQGRTGMWAYPQKHEDLSNTLFAVLALRVAAGKGAVVDEEVWREMIEGAFECHDNDEGRGSSPLGFSYLPVQDATGSMTVAGLSCLLIGAEALEGELGRKDQKRIEEAVERGLAWIDRHMVWDENPNKNNWDYFWIYGIERIGGLLGTATLGGVSWYPAGAEYLIKAQHKDGHWYGGHTDIDTVLGLLFLNRATAPTSDGDTAGDWRLVLSPTSSESGEPRRPVVRARLAAVVGEHLEAWIEDLGDVDPGEVRSVEWLALVGGEERVLARVEASEDGGVGRFAARITEPPSKACELVVRVHRDGASTESVPLALPALYTVEELTVGTLQAQNLLRGATAGASSARSGCTPRDAIDGKQGSNWILEPADREPRWWADLASSARASRLVLVHRGPSPQHAGMSRVTRVQVLVNGKPHAEVDLDPDPMRATTVAMDPGILISKLELVPLGFTGDAASGFSEVLLLP